MSLHAANRLSACFATWKSDRQPCGNPVAIIQGPRNSNSQYPLRPTLASVPLPQVAAGAFSARPAVVLSMCLRPNQPGWSRLFVEDSIGFCWPSEPKEMRIGCRWPCHCEAQHWHLVLEVILNSSNSVVRHGSTLLFLASASWSCNMKRGHEPKAIIIDCRNKSHNCDTGSTECKFD